MSEDPQSLAQVIASEQHLDGALLPILHALQNRFGYIPEASIPLVADALRVTRADVVGVISFYSYFRRSPAGRHVMRLCRAEACQARGSRVLEDHLREALGVDLHETTADGRITLESVYCLGNCAVGPNLMVDDVVHGKVSVGRCDQILRQLDASGSAGAEEPLQA